MSETATSSPTILFVCTGNAARSVMGAAMMRAQMPHVTVTSAGTHSISGLPMSSRTRDALAGHDVADPTHLSEQVEQHHLDDADLVVIFEPMHLVYLRKHHADAAHKIASLRRLAKDLASGPVETLGQRIGALDLADASFEAWEEVIDPAGGDLAVFQDSAAEISELVTTLVAKIESSLDP